MRLKCSTPKAGLTLPRPLTGEDWGDEFNHVPSYPPLKETSGSCLKGATRKRRCSPAGGLPLTSDFLQTPGNRLRQVRGLPKFTQLPSHRSDSNCSPTWGGLSYSVSPYFSLAPTFFTEWRVSQHNPICI